MLTSKSVNLPDIQVFPLSSGAGGGGQSKILCWVSSRSVILVFNHFVFKRMHDIFCFGVNGGGINLFLHF